MVIVFSALILFLIYGLLYATASTIGKCYLVAEKPIPNWIMRLMFY